MFLKENKRTKIKQNLFLFETGLFCFKAVQRPQASGSATGNIYGPCRL